MFHEILMKFLDISNFLTFYKIEQIYYFWVQIDIKLLYFSKFCQIFTLSSKNNESFLKSIYFPKLSVFSAPNIWNFMWRLIRFFGVGVRLPLWWRGAQAPSPSI